ncbi:thermosome subunit alpha [Halobacteria archaeon AArc-m2/3/4]|uniref:Thermosome subunit alpha n=1 Tax=Natronoglomus mannanivorans TaxID=2979990 RepID=A0AAP3E236_9EURY|nr:thermosome subunit alpha [Halobacteria archaeon AArc-xg1-1]MCU4975107.1 thermosome subunit alpha [Halobacteria archaeon AArc-m2/3/4]
MFILSEDSQRTQGRDAQSSNIMAGKAVAESVRTTLGPRGMDKMLVSSAGDVVITNDGATILNKMDIEHPAAQMIVEVAETQENEVGDGTTTAAVLAGNLLGEAEDLLDQDVHATTIVEGYHEAARIALEAIDEQVVGSEVDDDVLKQVAESSMTGKGTGGLTAEALAETVVSAIRHVDGEDGVARDNVTVHTEVGASSNATEMIEGIVVDEEPAHDEMPTTVEDADISILDVELGVRTGDVDAEYSIDSIDQLNAALDAEESELRGYAQTVADSGVDVLFTTDSVDDRVASFLANEGVLVFDDLNNKDARKIASATGAARVGALDDLADSEFGHADRIRTETYGDEDLVFVEGGAAAEAVTVFVRGGTDHVVDELERTIGDALDVVSTALDSGEVVPGAGATEIAIADRVRSEAAGVEGRKQLAVTAFADALDIIPRTLAANTGQDPIDVLVDLRAAHESEGRAGLVTDGESVEISDPIEHGVVDPADVKREAIESATEAATMIARIDDVIAAE